MKELITNKDYEGIKRALTENPSLANEGIPFDEKNTTKAHPLHRICDGVFAHTYTDKEAVEMARIFLAHGANVNGYELTDGQDTPLTAAASLHAEETGILYIENGAAIDHAGCHGGTALHWAAWVGSDKLVEKLIREKADIHKRCVAFKGTPLLWAVHGLKYGGAENRRHQVECVRLLLAAGADKTVPNIDGTTPLEFLDETDTELIDLLK
ncbi:ankyrin repeat domain-containing protein [Chitinophaga ginsengisegetis]|uniref:ankyrin repeat domain-containing protein n=1 Tax=Chitinophaga ginsengisegetis TaxID=393003 RepID=UPI000DB91A68|nr:ankyrin repeat domain-containing protein [Chitinophaga ginsengisegetis]MDR6569981.1 ankyrin repeat protein [Chitinophaga ginsengisegetis]MDR6649714.1 ankyrin repeat protein [Chitinophaga ginsengisegetis]MDR6656083.1 ankyrin repeat protein [Chitinophaga ginsengisegetis]